jgi:hypothetical protein
MSENRPPSPEYDDDSVTSASSTPPQPPPFSPVSGPSYDLIESKQPAPDAVLMANNSLDAKNSIPSTASEYVSILYNLCLTTDPVKPDHLSFLYGLY